MQPPPLYSRPVTSPSSSESKHKSPLSISSSVDYDYASSRTSEDSFFSNPNIRTTELSKSRIPFRPGLSMGDNAFVSEPVHSSHANYGNGQQQPTWAQVQRPSPAQAGFRFRYSPRVPGETFRKLPEEILLVILEELKTSHLQVGSLSCSTCLMRDLVNLGLSCQKWWNAAKVVLYEDIQLNGCDSVLYAKKKVC